MSNYDGYDYNQMPSYQAPHDFSPPPAPRRGLPGPVIALLAGAAVLVLVLVGGGIFLAVNRLAGPKPPPPPTTMNCWNGGTVPTSSSCPELTGDKALQYVYGADNLNCDVIGASLKPSLVAGMDCSLKDDSTTNVYLTQWKNSDVASKELGFRYKNPSDTLDGITTYKDDTTDDGSRARLTQIYQDYPFSVAVEADTVEKRDAALTKVHPKAPRVLAQAGKVPTTTAGAVECWDGSGADSSAACPKLTGQAALEWIFKDEQMTDCQIMDSSDTSTSSPTGTATLVFCRLADHPDVSILLSEWDSLSAGQTFMAKYQSTPKKVSPGQTWTTKTKSGTWITEWMYDGYPYSQAVLGPSEQEVTDGLGQLSARSTAELEYRGVVPGA